MRKIKSTVIKGDYKFVIYEEAGALEHFNEFKIDIVPISDPDNQSGVSLDSGHFTSLAHCHKAINKFIQSPLNFLIYQSGN